MTKAEQKVAEKMKALGVYKPEFDPTITRYVALSQEYKTLYAKYKKDGYPFEAESSQGAKKAPIVVTLESLRRDLLAIEDALGLTPRGLMKLQEEPFRPEKIQRRADRLI